MENNPFANNPFAPANPPAPPESGLAEFAQSMDPELEDAYNVAMAEPEPTPVFVPVTPEVDPLAAVVQAQKVEAVGTPTPAPTYTAEQEVLNKALADVQSNVQSNLEPVKEERKRARRFHADTPFVLGVLLFLVAAMAAASFYVSFSGLFAAAAWAVGDNPPLQFAVPIMLDIAIIAFTLALFVERERGERVVGTWIAIAAFATVSATANILHTLVVSTATDNYQLLVGSVISGGAPILLAFATDKIAIKVFKRADKS